MKNKIKALRKKLSKVEKKIFDSIMKTFPATDPESAYNVAIQEGVNFQYIPK